MLEINLLSPKRIARYWNMAEFTITSKSKTFWASIRITGRTPYNFYHISKVKDYITDIPN